MLTKCILLFLTLFLCSCSKNNTSSQGYVATGEVVINANLKDVWNYNSDDRNAKDWSTFFAKIVPCPTEDCPENLTLKPGTVGSVRRSYRNENETGIFWDEVTLTSKLETKNAYRKIIAYNFHGYSLQFLETKMEVVVEQFYTVTDGQKILLKFKARLQEKNKLKCNNDEDSSNDTSSFQFWLINFIYKNITGPRTTDLFHKNLVNIKTAIEQKGNYAPVFPYEKFCDPSKWYCIRAIQDF